MIGLLHKILVKYHGTAFFIIILPYIPKTIRFFIIITFNIYENIILLVGLINANVIQSLTIKYQPILRSILLNRNTTTFECASNKFTIDFIPRLFHPVSNCCIRRSLDSTCWSQLVNFSCHPIIIKPSYLKNKIFFVIMY